MSDLRIAYLDPLAQLLLIRMLMMAECAGGWLKVGEEICTPEKIAALSGLPIDTVQAHLPTLTRLALVGYDAATGVYFIPERVHKEKISETRRRVAKAGGGNPALRKGARPERLFKQKESNVISFEKAKGCESGGGAEQKKKKEPKKKKINNNIYTPEFDLGDKPANPGNPLWFEHGCIKLRKNDYQRWAADFPCFTDDELHAILVNRADWLETQPESAKSRWFLSTRYDLQRRHALQKTKLFGKGGAA